MAVRKAMGLPAAKRAKPAAVDLPPEIRVAMGLPAKKRPTPKRRKKPKGDYRTGRIQFGGWIPFEAKEQLDVWAARNRWTRQMVLEHALNLFFAEQGLQRIAVIE